MGFPKPQDSLLEDNGETRGLSEMAMEKLTGPFMWISLRVGYIFNGTILIWTMGSGGALFSDNPNSVYFQHFHSANSSSILGLDHCEPHHANNHHQKWRPDDLGEVENWGVQQHTCSGFSGFGWGGAVHSWECSLAGYGHGAVEKIKFACDSSFFSHYATIISQRFLKGFMIFLPAQPKVNTPTIGAYLVQ